MKPESFCLTFGVLLYLKNTVIIEASHPTSNDCELIRLQNYNPYVFPAEILIQHNFINK